MRNLAQIVSTSLLAMLTSSQVFAAAAASAALAAAAPEPIRLGEPGYGGTGCPAGTVSATLSPDQTSLSLLFDAFTVSAPTPTGGTLDRKTCQIAIPVTVPQGYSIGIVSVDYRGFHSLPYGAMSQFSADYFFAGRQGPRFSKAWYGQQDSDYLFNNTLGLEAVVWSPCGAQVILRTNASMYTRTNAWREPTLSTVDSADIAAGVVYQIQWRRCDGSGGVIF
jgi:hypothetical protein